MSAGRPRGRMHFIGVGGAGMSAVAYLMSKRGYEVSGSDGADGPYLQALAKAGVDVRVGHNPEAIIGVDEVVVSSAIRDSNVELKAAREKGIPVIHRSEALVRATEGMRTVAIAGAHGKTTTAAMTARALHAAGIDATFAIGAPVLGVDGAVGGAYFGADDVAVLEADESDGSFLAYSPEVAVITNVEADHLDHFGTVEAVEEAFMEFAGLARLLIVCADDAGARRVIARVSAGIEVVTYGRSQGADVRVDAEGIERAGVRTVIQVLQPGWHNRLNAAAAVTAAVAMGAEPGLAALGLASFAGTGRRFEPRGSADGVEVVDDYAHHPTEIAALIGAARERHPGHLVVLFQPHLYSRTRLLARQFASALTIPDADVVIAGVYGAREEPEPGVDGNTIGRLIEPPAGGSVRVVGDLREAAIEAASLAHPGDLLLTVGAGSVTEAADWILGALQERAARG